MKKIIIILVLMCSCNMSDQEINLPEGYLYYKEGGYSNAVLRNHKGVIEHSAIDFSHNNSYIMFVFDTLKVKPEKIDVKKLFFLVHDIKNDSLLKRMNFMEYKQFVKLHKIDKDVDLTSRVYK